MFEMEGHDHLQAPILLIAMPQVMDPFFHRSVVLLVHHDDEGSLGFIINRPTAIPISEILQGLELTWGGDHQALAGFGGPVQPQVGTVLFAAQSAQQHAAQICPGISLTQHLADLASLAAMPPGEFRLLLGYAGWSAGQLEAELVRNDWVTAPVHQRLIFTADPERTWGLALESVGIDPASLPSWSPATDDETAN
jgi:putative transcriptional regulator